MHKPEGGGLQGKSMGRSGVGRSKRRIREICQPCIQEHEHAVGGHDTRGRGEKEKVQEDEGGGEKGIIIIMRQEGPEGREPGRWRSAGKWLRKLPGWGISTLQEVQKERSVILPEMMRQIKKEEEVRELEWAVENVGVQLKVVWAGEGQRQAQTPRAPKLREAARGEQVKWSEEEVRDRGSGSSTSCAEDGQLKTKGRCSEV
jgi:hypothetical protein